MARRLSLSRCEHYMHGGRVPVIEVWRHYDPGTMPDGATGELIAVIPLDEDERVVVEENLL